jgi:hypothetical protein
MYYYLFYGYMIYKASGYINVLDTAIWTARGIRCVWRLANPRKPVEYSSPYTDWILVESVCDESDWEDIPCGKHASDIED